MLSILKDDLRQRESDIEKLLDLLKGTHDDDLKKILSSSIILALYNLIEFLIRESVTYVIDDISHKRVHILDTHDTIQNKLVDHASSKDKYRNLQQLFNKQYCQLTVDKDKVVNGGNIDYRTLKTLLKAFTIDTQGSSFNIIYDGIIDLNTIKDARNQLAHGNIAFSDSTYSYDQLNQVNSYVNELIINIIDKLEICLNQKLYMK